MARAHRAERAGGVGAQSSIVAALDRGFITGQRGKGAGRTDERQPDGRRLLVAPGPHLGGGHHCLLVFLRVGDRGLIRLLRERGQRTPFIRSRLSARAVGRDAVLLPREDTGFDAPEPAAPPQDIDHQLDQELFLRALWVPGGPHGLGQGF